MKKSRSIKKKGLKKNELLPDWSGPYVAPDTRYCKNKEDFEKAVGLDFITHANEVTRKGQKFLVGLSHGQSPAGVHQYILKHYDKLSRPENIRYTFVNSKLKQQRGLQGVMDAVSFLKELLNTNRISKDQILGRGLNRNNMEEYCSELNKQLAEYLIEQNKVGLDYMFLATDPEGRVAGVVRNSKAFDVEDIGVVVHHGKEKELTLSPHFIKRTERIAFLATKSDKRRALAWLYYRWGKENESPSFLRFMDDVKNRMTVFIDDKALTWPQIKMIRETPYGASTIRIDMANPYKEQAKEKLPVVLLIHGFLGLNSYDGLLTAIPSHKYIAAAMHYGTIPNDLPISEYSNHIVKNIDSVVSHFGKLGHPVYIFDHSMGNIYFLMMEQMFDQLKGVSKYLKGRIGANPFFGEESKHAILGFMDNVILPSGQGIIARTLFYGVRNVIPVDSRVGVRNRGIGLSKWLISKDSKMRDRVWKAAKDRILYLMSNVGSLPHLNRIPIEQALNRLPAKIFAIQTHSALLESKVFDKMTSLPNMEKHNIPILILKSERDSVAKFVPRIYANSHANVIDITDSQETDLFREHLYHMVNPLLTTMIIDDFIQGIESSAPVKKKKATSKKAVA